MQLKTLYIHNIASISDAEIDFRGDILGNAPVFLICGETGSGKSTILDTICLALYGDTPRMTSASKEELELSDAEARNRYYTNDNSQLLRRGTGEGFCRLLFTGNDGKDYEAVWEIHRNHDKPEKRLQRPKRGLRAVDNSFADHRIAEIDAKVEEVTGLQYEQFCRTVMLAQGEFTKFLKSRKEEKSEILEKLTGTEVYSQIGIKIAEKYNVRKNAWLELKREVENVRLMGEEEIASCKAKQEDVRSLSLALVSERKETLGKSVWLSTWGTLNDRLNKAVEEHSALKKVIDSEAFVKERQEVELYEISAEGRRLLSEQNALTGNLKKKESLLPELERLYGESVEKEKEACRRVEDNRKCLAEVQQKLDGYNLEELGMRYDKAWKADKTLTELINEFGKLKEAEETSVVFKRDIADLEKGRDEALTQEKNLEAPLAAAEEERERFADALHHGEISVSDTVKSIRNELKRGDKCPVCGSVIEKELSEEAFESMLLPLREGKKKADDRIVTLRTEQKTYQRKIKDCADGISRLGKDLDKWNVKISDATGNIVRLKKETGIEMETGEAMTEECRKRKGELAKEMEEVRSLQEQGNETLKEYRSVQKSGKKLSDSYIKLKENVAKAFSALEVHKGDIKSDKRRLVELKGNLEAFIESVPDVDMEKLSELASLDGQEMTLKGERIGKSLESLKELASRMATLSDQLEEYGESRPDFEEDESAETLKKRLEEIDVRIKETDMEAGRLAEVLRNDALMREEYSGKMKRLEAAREELDRWEGLYNKLGDQRGVKFRAVAQSFILRSLLENANVYMANFTDRYTLTCNPGTLAILVKDSYKPSDPQPASILSGGESFMASLALALALANLRSGGMGADVLFIDEGFGTLSAEYLGNVMDTLERLHQIGGRRVGLISHVPEMKERIPVHINVCRESPALSRVTVTNGCS